MARLFIEQVKLFSHFDRRIDDVINILFFDIKQVDSMLPCVCSVIDHRRHQNVVRTSVTHSAIASCTT